MQFRLEFTGERYASLVHRMIQCRFAGEDASRPAIDDES